MKKLQQAFVHCLHQEKERLVLWLPVMLGLGAALYFSLPWEPSLAQGQSVMGGVLALWFVTRRKRRFLPAFLAAIAVAAGFNAAILRTYLVRAPALSYEAWFRDTEGFIDEVIVKEKGAKLTLRDVTVERLPTKYTPARVRVSLRSYDPAWQAGDRVKLNATLFPPPRPSHPGGYDFARHYFFERIGAVGFSPGDTVEILALTPGQGSDALKALRHGLAERLRAGMASPAGEVAAALIVGEQAAIPEEVKEAMRASGLAHVLSISGLHLSIAAGLLFFSLRFLLLLWPRVALRLPVKKIAAAGALLGAFAYLQLAGVPVPAQRSFVMVAFVLLAVLLDRQGISLYSLAWAATVILLLQPESLLGASFQMSFAATLAIVALYERYGGALSAPRREGSLPLRFLWYLLAVMATSLVAGLATTPFTVYHFNQFTPWGLLANLLVIPLMSFWIMPAAVLALLLMPPGVEGPALYALQEGIDAMLLAAAWSAALPGAALLLPSLPMWGLALVTLGGLWLCLWRARWRLLGLPAIALGMASVAWYDAPDLFVSDDGKQVAARLADGRLTLLKGSGRSFDAEQWLRSDAGRDYAGLREALADAANGLSCDDAMCRYESGGKQVVLLKARESFAAEACPAQADVLIADFYTSSYGCKAGLVIDRDALEKNGAYALWISPEGIRAADGRTAQGQRPWTRKQVERRRERP